jgi:hypothetical protein
MDREVDEHEQKTGSKNIKGRMMFTFSVHHNLTKACSGRR